MCFIDDEEKFVLFAGGEPFAGVTPDFSFSGAQEHVFQHGIVGNQYIRAELLHLETGDQLCVFRIWGMIAIMKPIKEISHVCFGWNLSFFLQMLEEFFL